MKKNQIKLNESELRNIVKESVKTILKEYENNLPEYPDDVYKWAEKVQALGLELSRLCGKYRFNNEELYQTLSEIESEYNAVCGDLNTYGIAPHWSR